MEQRRVPRWLDVSTAVGWRILVLAAVLVLAAYVLVRVRLVVLPVIAALFVASLLVPAARWLERHGWPRLLATFAVLVGSGLLAAGLAALVGFRVASEVDELAVSAREGLRSLEGWLIEGPLNLTQAQLDRYVQQGLDRLQQNANLIAGGLMSGAVLALEVIAGAAMAVVLVFFFLKDGERLAGWLRDRFPVERRDRVSAAGGAAWTTLRRYLLGTAVVGLVDAVVIGVGLVLIGVPVPLALATLVFLGAFFPLVGAFLAGLLAVLVALASGGAVDALLVLGLVVVVQQVEGDVVAPVAIGRAVRLHPIVILLALTAGAVVAGVVGAFLAIPLVGVGVAVHDALESVPGARSVE